MTRRVLILLLLFFFLKRETDELSSSRRVRRATLTNPRCSLHLYFLWRKQQRTGSDRCVWLGSPGVMILPPNTVSLWPIAQGSEGRKQVRPVKHSGLWSIFGQRLNGVSDRGSCWRGHKKKKRKPLNAKLNSLRFWGETESIWTNPFGFGQRGLWDFHRQCFSANPVCLLHCSHKNVQSGKTTAQWVSAPTNVLMVDVQQERRRRHSHVWWRQMFSLLLH